LQSRLEEIHEADAEVMAISTDSVQQNQRLAADQEFEFPLLADPQLSAIDAYHLRHPSGNPAGADIARPAVFIIDRQGIIRWQWLTDNWRIRARPETILKQLATLY
jgi:peroxiredoxin